MAKSSATSEHLLQTHNTLAEDVRMKSIDILNKHLAAAIDLHAQVKQAHWNVRGAGFMAVHLLFDTISGEVEEWSDMLAERAGQFGSTAHGTVQVVAKNSFLVPYPLGIAPVKDHIFAIASALAAFGQSTREAISLCDDNDDPATADLFTEITRGIDKQLWFVESHITLP